MGIEIISALLASLLGALFPILKKLTENYLRKLNKEDKEKPFNKGLLKILILILTINHINKD